MQQPAAASDIRLITIPYCTVTHISTRAKETNIKDKRPLPVRILTTFLTISIAMGVASCVADNRAKETHNGGNPPVESTYGNDGSNAPDTAAAETETGFDSKDGGSKGGSAPADSAPDTTSEALERYGIDLLTLAAYDGSYNGSASITINGGDPVFEDELMNRARQGAFEEYAALDSLSRATTATVCAGPETLPTEERGSIGEIRPTGWHLTKYDWIDGKYLYNRCHLVGYQISGENANMRNLITGTRHLNVEGMLPYENAISDCIEETGSHVLYRVTPLYAGTELVSRGVLLEAASVETNGAELRICVFCPNVQPGVSIDYATGASTADGSVGETTDGIDESQYDYILNENSKRIHEPTCPSVDDMKESNKRGFNGTVEEARAEGYAPCGNCRP